MVHPWRLCCARTHPAAVELCQTEHLAPGMLSVTCSKCRSHSEIKQEDFFNEEFMVRFNLSNCSIRSSGRNKMSLVS